jgi:DNA mismatch endonuclease (patch repair protein)
MVDRVGRDERSRNMSLIRKFGNRSTELQLVSLLRLYGLKGWRRHVGLPGRPDFAFFSRRVAVFVDGCFWHNCPRCRWIPASNVEYWKRKFARNRARDRKADRELREAGWRVIRVWEHSLKRPVAVIARIKRALASNIRRPVRSLVTGTTTAMSDTKKCRRTRPVSGP